MSNNRHQPTSSHTSIYQDSKVETVWIAFDYRSFGMIVADWINEVAQGDLDQFCRHLGLGAALTRSDIIGLITETKSPSRELTNLLSSLLPAHVGSSQVLRNRGDKEMAYRRPEVTISRDIATQVVQRHLSEILNDESPFLADHLSGNAFSDWLRMAIEDRVHRLDRDIDIRTCMQNLAAYLNLSFEQLVGKEMVALDRATIAAEQLASVLGVVDEAFDEAVRRAVIAWSGGTAADKDRPLGQAIRFLRIANGETQERFAARLGIPPPYMSLLEQGIAVPTDRVIRSIANSFALSHENVLLLKKEVGRAKVRQTERLREHLGPVMDHFSVDDLTSNKWITAAQRHPSIIYRKPESLIENIETIIRHFANDGLTTEGYLAAAAKRPTLYCQKPDTVIKNVEGVMQHFASEGLTARSYLTAAVRQPQLFNQLPATLINNIEAVVGHFASDGLTAEAYLTAATKRPTLFCQKPDTVITNIEGVLQHFASDGLSARSYLTAAVRQPALFYQKPATLVNNIEGFLEHFAKAGLDRRAYLAAAIKQPSLFCQKPSNVIGHMNMILAMYHRESRTHSIVEPVRQPEGPRPPPKALDVSPVFDYVLRNPKLLTYSDDHLQLRDIAAVVAGIGTFTSALSCRKSKITERLRLHLGDNLDSSQPVQKLTVSPNLPSGSLENPDLDTKAAHAHARNLLLRALIREGLIEGKLAPDAMGVSRSLGR